MSDRRSKSGKSENQGEGDRESAKKYNEATRDFVESGKLEDKEGEATGQDATEAEVTERIGRERAKEEDPEVKRDYDKPAR
jgi:hypothetical protein